VDAMQEELLQFKIQDIGKRKGKIDEEVYVSQPLGFIDPKYPKKLYKVVKALYGLHQAPRTIDKTIFIKKDKHDIILVQVYVDDIIFGSTKKSWCDEFEALMQSRFQMSSMGELTFFLGLQVKQKEDDHDGSLIVLTASTADIMLAVCACLVSGHYKDTLPSIEIHNRRLSISWQETYFLAMQKADNCGYFYYRGIVAAAIVVGKFVDAKSNVRLWVQFHELKEYSDKKVQCALSRIRFQFLVVTIDNMVAYLEKTEGNAEFHEVIDFLAQSSIHHALTVEGATQETLSESQPTPSPTSPIGIMEVTDQAKEIKHLKAQIKKLKKQAKPVITHHRAWIKSVSLKQILAGKKSKESVSKQGRKSAKAEPSVHKDPLFDELDDDELIIMDTEIVSRYGKDKIMVTDKEEEGTDKDKDSIVSLNEGTDDQTEEKSATPITLTTTPTMFGDDETIAQVLLNMSQAKAVSREKEKGVELKDVEETERPRPTSTRSLLTLKPLPKIDPKIKGKRKIERKMNLI
ncbi:putative ribonuclease H-like domain-containing protein, partial [Tanacetum coccineum]